MNFDQLQLAMNYSFHDSRLNSFQVDYIQSEVKFDISLDIAIEDSKVSFRDGMLIISGMVYCVVEPVHPEYLPMKKGSQWLVDVGPLSDLTEQPKHLPPVSEGEFSLWMFLNDLNCFIYVSGRECRWVWKE
jgi:hypothetical protein